MYLAYPFKPRYVINDSNGLSGIEKEKINSVKERRKTSYNG